MDILRSYVSSSFSDGMIPHLRTGVEEIFAEVVDRKGIPSRQEFRELRNRVDMLDYNTRELTRTLNELKGRMAELREGLG
jgi:hypothetical protein